MHYKSYLNINCEFYPCHTPEHLTSCMFCWCPLYLLDCKGRFLMINGVKDCSHCVIPHIEGGYEHILEVVKEKIFNQPSRHPKRRKQTSQSDSQISLFNMPYPEQYR